MHVQQSLYTILISLFTTLSSLHQWYINPQPILVGGGVTAVMMGVALSTIVGNILSGGLVLTTFPARIGDLVLVVSDKGPGGIDEATLLQKSELLKVRNIPFLIMQLYKALSR